ncbi:anthranilate synthase component I family protein [Listeria immobilis]|uniref:Anthranilate synthase component I family protein n=1 Tax=Listeria immobilis TaxID=2713502 RepID=A0ABR6SZT8_9LIST|nr:anthranilate synthase component I family protein [Listeria immobilis]MBC1484132.1 anthranilate synthase component I family protein [Listeria immobilis]MBC1508104.1 anthranilate synthase component I family protein [Listeria immobilis]MBC1511040.1 anthranilate synthase component I family protein [Listeria immobilis]MBC1517120.1 anthranilate synthase component I family protein [Listeria immobilis]MBC6304440.1 anthranilate synthase component I family protein [Listeria immobilis]
MKVNSTLLEFQNNNVFDLVRNLDNQHKNIFFLDNSSSIGKEEKSYIGWNVIDSLELLVEEKKADRIIAEIDDFINKWSSIGKEIEEGNLRPNFYVYLSYDFGERLMGIKSNKEKEDSFFDVAFYVCKDNLVYNCHTGNYTYINITNVTMTKDSLISRFKKEIKLNCDQKYENRDEIDYTNKIKSNFKYDNYIDKLKDIKKYIFDGHIYQVNMSQRFTWTIKEKPIEIYNKIRRSNPAPYSAYFKNNNLAILSTSPECFLSKRNNGIKTEPIKGTRPSGNNKVEEQRNYESLLNSEKERSENTMIVDLLRNDLGRIAKPGTVRVEGLMFIEKYASVLQLVSKVSAELKDDITFGKIIRETFPGGSITGCPKKRAMEVILESEPLKRSLYTGSLGRVSFDSLDFDLNILIRTIFLDKNNASLSLGGGVVFDSVESKEYQETLDKGEAIIAGLCRKSTIFKE